MQKNAAPWTFARIFSSRWMTVGLLVGLGIFGFGIGKELMRQYEIGKEIHRLERSANELQNQNQDLSELLTYFETSAFTEREARLKLGYQKNNETAVVIPAVEEDGTVAQVLGAEIAPEPDLRPNPVKWFDYFF